ncbi:MAG: efflux RND transporter periplasmic adaptor subunit [Saprospiraceae bacterium]|nr:efflux RND transporter periplasmic adaptor subunit [Saprospiraceae bacterium]
MKKINRTIILTVLVTLVLGIFIGRWIAPGQKTASFEPDTATKDAAAAVEWWTCSMHPQIRQHEPGKCPICGMDLIPLTDETGDADPLAIRMSATAMQLANVQTEVIRTGNARKEIRVIGKAQADERKIYSQVTHLEGRIESLKVNFTGEEVKQGQVLATIYSPDLVNAQQELFTAYAMRNSQPGLYQAAREKLKNWKISETQIDDILATGKPRESFPITADVSGLVMEKKVNLGDYVMRGMPLYDIVDLSRLWVLFDIYEQDLDLIRVGSKIEFSFQSLPGIPFTSRITFIDPVIDPATRSAKARVEVANPGGRLKPEMFATGTMELPVGSPHDQIVIPASAVLWTGERSLVYVKNPDSGMPSFVMHEINLGPDLGDSYLVKEGLKPGMEIVVHGTFAVDAAAQLAGKPSMMNPQMPMNASARDTVSPQMSVPLAVKNATGKLLNDYLLLKDALVAGDLESGKEIVKRMELQVSAFPSGDLQMPAAALAREHLPAMGDQLKKMVGAQDLAKIRDSFKPLSQHMISLVSAFGSMDRPVYVQHCPMADHNRGADWLSLQKNILNPYFGDAMLTCGSTVRVIED